MAPCKCCSIKRLSVCTVPLTGGSCAHQPRHMAHLRMPFTQSQVPVLLCEFSVTTVFPRSSYELDLLTSFLVTCYCHDTKPTVSYILVAELGESLKALNFFPQLLMERKVMFCFLSLSYSVMDFCKHQTLVCVCVCVCVCVWVCVCVSHSVMSDSLWSHGHSLPGSSVFGIFQVRTLQWVAISSSRGSQPKGRTWVSCTAGRFFTIWATRVSLTYQ